MRDPIQIAFGCDEVFAPHAGVVIQSILHNSSGEDHFVFNVVTTGLSIQTHQRLLAVSESNRSSMRLHALDISNLKNLPACHLTPNAYLRMFLPDLLPELERVIYLDCDLLAVASLRRLWETRLRPGTITAACEDIYSIYAKLGDAKLIGFLDSLGIPEGESYFNSGVMLMDLAGWRAHSITAKACDWGAANPNLIRHADQDILNVILLGRVHYLPLRWNLSIHMIYRVISRSCTTQEKEATDDPAIIHYVGSNKANSLENPMPYQSEYLQRLAQTPWAKDFIPPQTLRQKFVRLRRRVKQQIHEIQLVIACLFRSPTRPIDGIVRVDRSVDIT